ncbi:MAG: hypothetical protein ACE5HC_14485 [Candidatus Binatia bacterium]
MANAVVCANCETNLTEDPGLSPEEQAPCPKCGSKTRKFFLRVEAGALALAGMEATLTVIPSTNLLLQTVVVPGEKSGEGQLIKAVALPWFEIVELLKNDPTIAYQIPARK